MTRKEAWAAATTMAILLCGFSRGLSAQETAPATLTFARPGTGSPVKLVERHDYSRYEDGLYMGHVYREVRALLGSPVAEGPALRYEGSFYLFEETLRDLSRAARSLDTTIPASYIVGHDGLYQPIDDQGYPSLRDFPFLPEGPVDIGRRWEAFATLVVDPDHAGKPTRLRVFVEYWIKGLQDYYGRKTIALAARFATRYKAGQDRQGDMELAEVSGRHEADILIDQDSGDIILIRDRVDESYLYRSGRKVRLKGFCLRLMSIVAPMDRAELAERLREDLGSSGLPGASVSEIPEGLSLSVDSIGFVADQAIILPGEEWKLDAIAAALRTIPGKTFFVKGHTAYFGSEESQLDLSIARAELIVAQLSARGIEASRFIYKGFGGTIPIAPNDSEEGRSKNRRVEIVILDD